MQTNQVDVLAVMGFHADQLCVESPEDQAHLDSMREARAAVAELVEAAKAMNELAKGPVGGVSQQQKREIIARVDAALARMEGAK